MQLSEMGISAEILCDSERIQFGIYIAAQKDSEIKKCAPITAPEVL